MSDKSQGNAAVFNAPVRAFPVFHALRGGLHALGHLESWLMRSRLRATPLDRPIYISGLHRSGTTILLEMLSGHPSVGTHLYADVLNPYVPYAWAAMTKRHFAWKVPTPKERHHQDRIFVTPLSAEGAEEPLWLRYFEALHSDSGSCVLRAEDCNAAFDQFYSDTLKKVLLARGRQRYLSRACDNVTRLLYVNRLFPDARLLIPIRHPVHHVASLLKQDRHMTKLAQEDPRVYSMIKISGRFTWGADKRWPVVDENTAEIRRLHDSGRVVRAWGMHWAAIYGLVRRQLDANPSLAAQARVCRYEDLCQTPGPTLDAIVAHCQLDGAAFAPVREKYETKLSAPTYYRPSFTDQELDDLDEVTEAVRTKYGYTASAREALGDPAPANPLQTA